jgi:hypothetical protein
MKNEFILHVTYYDNGGEENLLKEILCKKELDISLIFEKKINENKEVFCRIKIRPLALSKFKKMVDNMLHYQSIELFEYRMW